MDRSIDVPKVNDILTTKVFAVKPDFSQLDAVHVFNKHRISSAPVVSNENEVVGYITESDCIESLSNSLFYDDAKGDTIESIMTREVAVAEGDWDLFELESFFVSKHVRSAPVVDSENHLVGIVTRRDALLALEKIMHGRDEYKKEIKTPIELNMQNRIKLIASRS